MDNSGERIRFFGSDLNSDGYYDEIDLAISESGKVSSLISKIHSKDREYYDNKWNKIPEFLAKEDDIIGYIRKSKITQDIIFNGLDELYSLLCEEEHDALKEIFNNRIEERVSEFERSLRLKLKRF